MEARGLELARLRAAIETLATGDWGDDVATVFDFVRAMMEEASRPPSSSGLCEWLDGDLGVELARRREGGVVLRVVADTRHRVHEIARVPFARLSFEDVVRVAERAPKLLGPAFVLVEPGVVSVSVVRYAEGDAIADDEDTAPHDTRAWLDSDAPDDETAPTRQVRRSGVVAAEAPADDEATLVSPPPHELIRRSKP